MSAVAVIFDLDGVLIDSEQIWDKAREEYVREVGGRWHESAQRDMMGMSSTEWSRYMHERLAVPRSPERINRDVVERIADIYRSDGVPLIDGAREAVERLAAIWPLAIASSSNRPIIDEVLALTGLAGAFRATVSSEEVARGKPAADVYLAAAERLEVAAGSCAGVEDSNNGILALRAAGMRTIAIPNAHYPPKPETLAKADVVLATISELTPNVVKGEAC